MNLLYITCLFSSLFLAVSRLHISFMDKPPYLSYYFILERLSILMFAVSGKVLFNLSFDSLAFCVVSNMNIYSPNSYLWCAVTLMYEL